uniref:JmjC domain-containing protein n=1 Tax=Chaetoceros debilis TaxID=122233 RepID=A0A7S3Q1M7_9STRA|mmetsp:Transcript_22239/g.33903  ORF Transcript_22239/g.33903 Transcript_22239/m.33903 type:complete len:307 (+) Transcript_22239:108-1028(+)
MRKHCLRNFFRFCLYSTLIFVLCISNGDSQTVCSTTGNANNCKADLKSAGEKFKWELESAHRCNIRRVEIKNLFTLFKSGLLPPLYHEPLVIYSDDISKADLSNDGMCSKLSEITSLQNITSTLPDEFEVTLSSSNSFSAHRQTIPLTQYLNETLTSETLPHHLSNETWYLFGETYSDEWQNMLSDFCYPPCQTCTKDLSALSFGIGGRGSGVQWHTHGPGFSLSIHGRKHWILYPPEDKPSYDPDYTSRYWMEETYTKLPEESLPFECTLSPGEQLYFPDLWHHATINLDSYTAFVSTFTTEHGF